MFRFLKRNDSEVITPEVVDVPVMTIQSSIAMALALCMEEYLRSVSKTSVDIPNRDTLVREYNTLVDAGLGSSKNARLLQAKISEYNQIALDAMRAKNLFSFVKRAREVFGESTLLVGSKQFDDVCKKYKLVKTRTKDTTELELKFNIAKHIIDVKFARTGRPSTLKVRRKLSVRRFLTLWLRNKTLSSKANLWKNSAKELEALN